MIYVVVLLHTAFAYCFYLSHFFILFCLIYFAKSKSKSKSKIQIKKPAKSSKNRNKYKQKKKLQKHYLYIRLSGCSTNSLILFSRSLGTIFLIFVKATLKSSIFTWFWLFLIAFIAASLHNPSISAPV